MKCGKNENIILELFKETSLRLGNDDDKCENLIFSQSQSGKSIIREPEARNVMTLLLNKKNIEYALEVPTEEKYKFSGDKPDSANTDLVIYLKDGQINIEFKTGQPNPEHIEKDFEKLLKEPTDGCAFYHILKNTNIDTIPKLLKKYKTAYRKAYDDGNIKEKWFVLFIFVKEKRKVYWKMFDDITDLKQMTHGLDKDKLRMLDFKKYPKNG